MIIRKVDSLNDWTFGHGANDYAVDESAIEENIKTRVLSWLGDCFFALDEGVDWKSRLDIGQQDALKQEIKNVILQSFGVIGVSSVQGTFNGQTRNFVIQYIINTIFSSNLLGTIQQTLGI